MRFQRYEAVRYEGTLPEGRTRPLILACRTDGEIGSQPKVVKAIGCPEVQFPYQLVAELVGNATARRMGIPTPEPCIVDVSEAAARAINLSVRADGYRHTIQPGPAAGCDLIRPAPSPVTANQNLTAAERTHASKLYVFDLLSQNPDRRKDKENCGLTKDGVIAFDFEMCFGHLFLPIIGGLASPSWEPSRSFPGCRRHLFWETTRDSLPIPEEIVELCRRLSAEWWSTLVESLPEQWHSLAGKVATVLAEINEHADDFERDIVRSLI